MDLRQCQLSAEDGATCSDHFVSIVCSHPSLSLCPGSALPFRRHCYQIVQDQKSFSEAQLDCQQKTPEGGRLVNILLSLLLGFSKIN